MTSLWDLEVGDPVVVTQSLHRNSVPRQMVVVKKGRLLITVDDEANPKYPHGLQFRMQNGSYNSRDFPHFYHIYTLEEWADRELRHELTEQLREHGVDIRGRMETVILKALLDVVKGVIE